MKATPTLRHLKLAALLGAGLALATQISHAQQTYHVSVDTSSLSSAALSGNVPYGVDFQLNYGSGPFGNSATVSNISLGGGAAIDPAFLNGTAAGSLETGVTLSDDATNAFNEFTQNFTPGSTLSFDVTLSNNTTINTPDGFVLSLVEGNTDNMGLFLPTTALDGSSLATFAIGGDGLVAQEIYVNTYAGAGGDDPTQDFSGVTVSVVATPEPSAWMLTLGACLVFAGLRRVRKA